MSELSEKVNSVDTIRRVILIQDEPLTSVFTKWLGWMCLIVIVAICFICISTNFSKKPNCSTNVGLTDRAEYAKNKHIYVDGFDSHPHDMYFLDSEISHESLSEDLSIDNNNVDLPLNDKIVPMNLEQSNELDENKYMPKDISNVAIGRIYDDIVAKIIPENNKLQDTKEGLLVGKPYSDIIEGRGNSEYNNDLQDYMMSNGYISDTPFNPKQMPRTNATYYTTSKYSNRINLE